MAITLPNPQRHSGNQVIPVNGMSFIHSITLHCAPIRCFHRSELLSSPLQLLCGFVHVQATLLCPLCNGSMTPALSPQLRAVPPSFSVTRRIGPWGLLLRADTASSEQPPEAWVLTPVSVFQKSIGTLYFMNETSQRLQEIHSQSSLCFLGEETGASEGPRFLWMLS